MRRGDIVLVAAKGDYGKVRPNVVVQSELLNPTHGSVLVCLIESSFLTGGSNFRIPVAPTAGNGLDRPSEVMVDKVAAIRADRIRLVVGCLDGDTMASIDRALLIVLGLA
ncbi:growth inhibitor PemK [Skermanella stibiiresistens SB22]|uniref:Growth inhibitor PemK n=1 Tax=Skermanella stibiiresistens SB22 TaxID=1385369 RepID=W9GX27_9PROT|nr:type II toxin-antitoxin system PemK/MazF family toxin [Skermanella stibiiresistens]EWY38465.1 growth inhibitor PemK [Skermanella stibiiresistens SB22]